MKFIMSQKIFCMIFLIIIFGYTSSNLYTQGSVIWEDIMGLSIPSSFEEAKKNIVAIESSVNTNIVGKTKFIDGYAYLQILMGKEEIDNFKTVRSRDNSMNYANLYPMETDSLREYAKRIKRMQNYIGDTCQLFFLNPPAMYIRGESKYSSGIPYYDLNPSQDALLFFLQSYGVDYIDSRATFQNKILTPDQYIFNTDHHWTVQACFESFIDVVRAFCSFYDVDLDPDNIYTDINNYNVKLYPECFLGSLGKRTGAVFSGIDDFTLIWPKFDSDYLWEADSVAGSGSRSGSYEHSLLYPNALRTDDPYYTIFYNAYMGGIKTWTKITNYQNIDGAKLLMIHDSYSLPLATFLAPMFSEIHMIWPLADGEKVDIDKYVKEHEFDYIIIELYPGNYNDTGMNFFVSPLTEDE